MNHPLIGSSKDQAKWPTTYEPHSALLLSYSQRIVLLLAVTSAALLKFFMAITWPDSPDSLAFFEFYKYLQQHTAITIYQFRGYHNNPFNFPPVMIYVIRGLGDIAKASGLPYRFWLRMMPSIADIGSFFLVCRILNFRREYFYSLLLLALSPTSIMTNGYEGNIDALMIFFVVLSIWLLGKKGSLWLAGITFGLALNVKVVPLMFLPVFLFYLPSMTARAKFAGSLVLTLLVSFLPFILSSPIQIFKAVLGYSSIYGVWGLSKVAVLILGQPYFLHAPYDPIGRHYVLSTTLKYFCLATICVASFLMNRRILRPNLYLQCGIIVTLFLLITPGFGVQYLVWLLPFLPLAGFLSAFTYSALTLALYYVAFSDGNVSFALLVCWLSVILVFSRVLRCMFQNKTSFLHTSNAFQVPS